MITNEEEDEYGNKIVFKWELLEDEFKQVLIDSDRNIKDVDKWWRRHKDKVLHYFQKGFEILVENYGEVINQSIDEVWTPNEDELAELVEEKVNQEDRGLK